MARIATFFLVSATTSVSLGQAKKGAESGPQLAVYLQKSQKEPGIKTTDLRGALGYIRTDLDETKFQKSGFATNTDELKRLINHSTTTGHEPDETKTTDANRVFKHHFYYGVWLSDQSVMPVLAKEIKSKFNLGVPLELNILHDVQTGQMFVDVAPAK